MSFLRLRYERLISICSTHPSSLILVHGCADKAGEVHRARSRAQLLTTCQEGMETLILTSYKELNPAHSCVSDLGCESRPH